MLTSLIFETTAPKVDNLDATLCRMTQKYVLQTRGETISQNQHVFD
jgi:hypothetical protein